MTPEIVLDNSPYFTVQRIATATGSSYTHLVCDDWVNIVPVTAQGDLVLVKQYRLPVNRETTEIPAGAIQPNEQPLEAARRELAEETGYIAQ